MSKSYAKHRMRENRNNQYRPEQQRMCREISREFPEYSVLMEMIVQYKDEQDNIKHAIGDIVIDELGIYYRLNGEIHNSNRAEEKDWEQKLYLEELGWLVIDVTTYDE
jgi:very-short-patch-repair endonuclease